jgi:hypothetical protein
LTNSVKTMLYNNQFVKLWRQKQSFSNFVSMIHSKSIFNRCLYKSYTKQQRVKLMHSNVLNIWENSKSFSQLSVHISWAQKTCHSKKFCSLVIQIINVFAIC